MTTPSTDEREQPFRATFEVADHDALTTLLRTVQDADVGARAVTVAPARQPTVNIDLSVLTEKQRTTVELALAKGYYEQPREVALGTLADRLGVSKSAVSQRLRNAETALVTAAFES
jgi:predicted DNA binding protein